MRKARPCALSPSKLLGTPGLTLEGCDSCRGVVTSCSEMGGGGTPYINLKSPKAIDSKVGSLVETIPKNSGIHRFVWEHFQNLNRVVQWMKYCSGMCSGPKLFLCVPEIFVLGHRYTPQG
jgi:hypothetical protein